MGWPFKTSGNDKPGKQASEAKPNLMEKLLPFGKKPSSESFTEEFPPIEEPPVGNKWQLSDESLDTVSLLLSEVSEKNPGVTLGGNPYRTSMSLEDMPGFTPEMANEQVSLDISEICQAEMGSAPVSNKQSWSFDPLASPDWSKTAIQETSSNVVQTKTKAEPTYVTPEQQEKQPWLNAEITPDIDFDSDIPPSADTQDAFGFPVSSDELAPPMDSFSFEETIDEESLNLDDLGLLPPVGQLPVGLSLADLMEGNVLTFISTSKNAKDTFHVDIQTTESTAPTTSSELEMLYDSPTVPSFEDEHPIPKAISGFSYPKPQEANTLPAVQTSESTLLDASLETSTDELDVSDGNVAGHMLIHPEVLEAYQDSESETGSWRFDEEISTVSNLFEEGTPEAEAGHMVQNWLSSDLGAETDSWMHPASESFLSADTTNSLSLADDLATEDISWDEPSNNSFDQGLFNFENATSSTFIEDAPHESTLSFDTKDSETFTIVPEETATAAVDFFSPKHQYSLDNVEIVPPDDAWAALSSDAKTPELELFADEAPLEVLDHTLSFETETEVPDIESFENGLELPEEVLFDEEAPLNLEDNWDGDSLTSDDKVFELQDIGAPECYLEQALAQEEALLEDIPLEMESEFQIPEISVDPVYLEPPPTETLPVLAITETPKTELTVPQQTQAMVKRQNKRHIPAPRRTASFSDSTLHQQMSEFEAGIILSESRFIKNSIDQLVNHYFAQPDSGC